MAYTHDHKNGYSTIMLIIIMTTILSQNAIETCFSSSSSKSTNTLNEPETPDTYIWNQTNCGSPSISSSYDEQNLNRIINGEAATSNSWPWTVSLRVFSGNVFSHICGGTLVSSRIVVTAAHCFDSYSASQFGVVIGINDLSARDSGNTYYISQLTVHPNYDAKNILNDIAVIRLKRQVVVSQSVLPICLPSSNSNNVILNKNVIVTGWGSTDGKKLSSSLSNKLLQAKLRISNGQNACSGFSSVYYCAYDVTSKSSNICFGDSGGGLLYYSNSKWYLYGISSFVLVDEGTLQCLNNQPSFYTIVPNYLTWIKLYI